MSPVLPRLVLLSLLFLAGCEPKPPPSQLQVRSILGGQADEGFARALAPRPFQFPEDHAAHPEFRSEWWYVTGHLMTTEGRRFGFQVTFFRFALSPEPPQRASAWASQQIWMGHAALTDVASGRHQGVERFARGALDLAGTSLHPFKVWLGDWQLGGGDAPPWELQLITPEFGFDFRLDTDKAVVLQGDQGLSRKSAEPGNASYYYSLTRLETQGEILLEGVRHQVRGLAWLDREWSTSALGADQVGWDWFSLQFADGRDLMYYQLRDSAGHPDPHSGGSLTDPRGQVRRLARKDVELRPLKWWLSPAGRRYPIEWEMELRPGGEGFKVRAVVADQEMDLSVRYWEGAVDILDAHTGQPLGRGYLELAGY